MFTHKIMRLAALLAALAVGVASPPAVRAQNVGETTRSAALATPDALAGRATFADLVTLAERSGLVVRVQIRRQVTLEPERAPGLDAGFARLYVEADTLALIAGGSTIGESLVYLVDVPLTPKGKAPKLKNREMLLFANLSGRGPGGAAQLQLAGPSAQLAYSPALEQRIRPILTSLFAPDKPPVITGIRDALAVPGSLVGESETQIFLATQDRSPASLTVLRRPGQPPAWGVSWGEIIDSSARAPEFETLRWYRLACALPESLPSSANLARDPAARQLAASDYAYVINALGPCARAITRAPAR
ncbi:hypothetical protein [Erythrobacter sp.]|uniref:hypothetical protein n=1 Tax=Erythrobacter sp. TaxID=1042 RepID=UPI002623F812|nr:hypothetical protein [Erythrobacter sp.]